MREPSFYLGLFRPWLPLVLRGGIAYPWGLQNRGPGPVIIWILTLETFSSPDIVPTIIGSFQSNTSALETSYVFCLQCFVASYSSPFFHIEMVIAAILRAIVSFARFGLVPAVSNRR